jgi:hypothetical protein
VTSPPRNQDPLPLAGSAVQRDRPEQADRPAPAPEAAPTQQPHDALFKAVFSEPANAAAEIAAALPRELVEALDLGSLEAVPGSFVDERLRQSHTDLLFRVRLREDAVRGGTGNEPAPGGPSGAAPAETEAADIEGAAVDPARGNGRDTESAAPPEALVYVVLAHQSTQPPLMAFRLLRYVVRVWERWLDDHPGAPRLPVVAPLVLHHGPRRWAAPRALSDLYDLPRGILAGTRAILPELRFALDDLAATDEQALLARPAPPFAAAALCLLQAAPRGHPMESVFERVGVSLRAVARSRAAPSAWRCSSAMLWIPARSAPKPWPTPSTGASDLEARR